MDSTRNAYSEGNQQRVTSLKFMPRQIDKKVIQVEGEIY